MSARVRQSSTSPFLCSADSNNATYAINVLSGTSMATPLTAGAAALVREWYRTGWAVCRQANASSTNQYISAALLKATLVNAANANSLKFQSGSSIPVSPTGMRASGYGLIGLDSVIRTEPDTLRTAFWYVW